MTNYRVNTNDCCERKTCCDWIAFVIFAALFLFVLGLLIGAALALIILINIVPFLILAGLLFVLAAVAFIVHRCNCRNRSCD